MKLLVITLHADPTIHPGAEEGGGTHMYINEVINLLIYKQVSSLIITRKASPGNDLFDYENVKIKRIKLGPKRQWNKNFLSAKETEINQLIKDELDSLNFNPTLIHSVYWYSGRSAITFSDKYKIPFIHTIISNGKRKQISGYDVSDVQIATEMEIFNKASVLISVSNQEKEDMVHLYGINPEKIKVIGRGVDNIFLNSLYDSKGTLIAKPFPDVKSY
jgi:glycosyltransferase involved in cell wall biosynthesis